MATVGVKGLRMALINPETMQVITGEDGFSESGIFDAQGRVAKGLSEANITGLAPSITKVWGNDQLQDQSVGKSQPSVATNFNDLPHEILEKALGEESDGKGGFMDNASGVLPHIAMDIISSDLLGNVVHYCFYDGNMTQGDKTIQTSNENQTRAADALTFSPLAGTNGHMMKTYYGVDKGFTDAALIAEIFPGAKGDGSTAATNGGAGSQTTGTDK